MHCNDDVNELVYNVIRKIRDNKFVDLLKVIGV